MIGKNTLAALIMLGACGAARAQSYFDFDSIPGLPDQPSVQIDLNEALLGFAAAVTGEGDPRIGALLEGIDGVRVRVYEELEDMAEVASFVDDASGQLEREGWHRMVYAEHGEGTVRLYARLDGAVMNGLAIMALREDEAAFVNVAGRISAEQLGRIAGAMRSDDAIGELRQLARGNARQAAR